MQSSLRRFCLWFLLIGLLVPISTAGLDRLMEAAIFLKKAHVERFWEDCQRRGGSEAECRATLNALWEREKKALARIAQHLSEDSGDRMGRESAACYSPGNNYADLIGCWERLADRLDSGETAHVPVKPPRPWEQANAKVRDLSPFDRKAVVLCVRGSFTVNYKRTVKHNLYKGGSDELWALKIFSRGNAKLSQLAAVAQWSEMESYFKTEASDAASLIRGELDTAAYQRRAKANEQVLAGILDPERRIMSRYAERMKAHQGLCEQLSDLIVADAKVFASQK